MWEKHEKYTSLASATGRAVTMSRDGKLTISSALMDELGRPATVDIYFDRDEAKIGLTLGSSYQVAQASDSACVGTVSTTGTLNALHMDADARARNPRFEVVRCDDGPMLVVWPLIPSSEAEVDTEAAAQGGQTGSMPDCPHPAMEAAAAG